MRIDTAAPQAQKASEMAVQPRKEVAGEREHDGDADDAVKTIAKNPTAQQQIKPQGVGNTVDFLA
jgi:isopropylmalate/homocitrate/citramalate synthase